EAAVKQPMSALPAEPARQAAPTVEPGETAAHGVGIEGVRGSRVDDVAEVVVDEEPSVAEHQASRGVLAVAVARSQTSAGNDVPKDMFSSAGLAEDLDGSGPAATDPARVAGREHARRRGTMKNGSIGVDLRRLDLSED